MCRAVGMESSSPFIKEQRDYKVNFRMSVAQF